MMCQRMGRLPIGAIGLGITSLTSRKRVPRPPHRIATFIKSFSSEPSHEAQTLTRACYGFNAGRSSPNLYGVNQSHAELSRLHVNLRDSPKYHPLLGREGRGEGDY